MKRFFSPPLDELEKLRTKLEPGEKAAIRFFHKHLHESWEIYIQPHLNGLRPDLILLNPKIGIAVYEIKDWDLTALNYYIKEKSNAAPELWASKNGEHFSLQKDNPIEKIFRYKQEIFELYCPRIENNAGFAVITAGVLFPYADETRLNEIFKLSRSYRKMDKYENYYPLIGKQSFEKDDIKKVFPVSFKYYSSKYMNENLAKDLKNWLIEPDFAATQRISLESDLDKEQRRYIIGSEARTKSGYRRIKGPAGSGKSLVLAARASQLIAENKKVLVVTFNITLLHYLMDIAVRYPHKNGNTREDITWLNFHYLCKRICFENGFGTEYQELWENNKEMGNIFLNPDLSNDDLISDILINKLPALVEYTLANHQNSYLKRFDAVLVDEGQDFFPHWWNILRKLCVDGGEMLLMADSTQDIYGTAKAWTDQAMEGAGFRGEFAKLDISYRMPPLLIDYVTKFAQMYLPKDSIDLPKKPQLELDLFPCKLKWIQTNKDKAENICEEEIRMMAPSVDPILLSIPDITFLTNNQKSGKIVSEKLKKYGMKVIHTFGDNNRDSKNLKLSFYMGDARIKATTLHSFKGWESRSIIIYIGYKYDMKSMFLTYTGMTRLKRHIDSSFLTVICAIKELEPFGKSWPQFEIRM
jgi:hypothetical protein